MKESERHGMTWSEKELILLGSMPDSALAGRLGRTQLAVRQQRVRRGVEPSRPARRWSSKEDRQALRRDLTAAAIGKSLCRTRDQVLMRRKRLVAKKAAVSA